MEDLYLVEDPSRFRREDLRREACQRRRLGTALRRHPVSTWWRAADPASEPPTRGPRT